MLNIQTDTLPQSCLSYLAFRVAFQETLERITLAHQIDDDGHGSFGFLTEVPFLRAVPPHVQLDLLAETWSKHYSPEPFEANMVDESVVYAVCETAARIVESEPNVFHRYLKNGPLDVEIPIDHHLSSELRDLHLSLGNNGDFLMISQFEDMEPGEAQKMKLQFGLDLEKMEDMFEVLSYWTISANFLSNVEGLLIPREVVKVARIIGGK